MASNAMGGRVKSLTPRFENFLQKAWNEEKPQKAD